MNFEVIEENFVTMREVKNILKDRKDLEMEQKLTKEHVISYKKLKTAQVESLKKELEALSFTKLKGELIVKIIDILPSDKDDLKTILQMSVIPFTDEEIEKIFECAAHHL
ncbi:hypothetical protein COX58_03515 [archaeon CG_4_10_14_0_2_um_filter_Archaea_38_6]|nr:MAG: hypothetical protein COS83_02650 [archaeon CG07_land_8_20_14_0_80_38_8]PIX44760.1 MAG: hypothetical protein COZ55_00090 [archaeon CG_4_8_14_3_um_filter_38_5]PJA21698.1 MAG: hypothetical protein COX58_03515 [archaeon CG_4_10_14_0_2_um_filter_Archaea_38_6]